MIHPQWLVERERRYGGRVDGVWTGDRFASGGDRMEGHGYAEAYARWLGPLHERMGKHAVVVEVGVLRGTGLAIWCDLFDRVIGLDRDPDLMDWEALREAGAFEHAEPEMYRFDQGEATVEQVGAILGGVRADVVIDDASHVDALTMRTLAAFRPWLAPGALYFVEDQPRGSRIHAHLAGGAYGMAAHRVHRSLTVLVAP